MQKFPRPVGLAPATKRWKLSDLLRYEAAQAGGDPSSVAVEHERFLTDRQVAERYGIARPTVWRWAAEEKAVA
ncbi:MAG: hypothetical protein AB7I32_01020 [Gammaproteobacteria bacterium]